ncbi:MAG: efflux RND transporter periplasmic adaptor subunit [Magnetococcales bacterium]|nr:efflux RND transporter periplasmic adaptor subunit [Magnetococcales bacterium]
MNKSIFSAIAIVLLLVAWMMSGPETKADVSDTQGQKADKKVVKPIMKVKVQTSRGMDMERFVTVKGQVEPLRSVTIKAETQGRVIKLPINKGVRVVEGELLAALSMNDRNARLSEARAMVINAERDLEVTNKLVQQKIKATNQLNSDEANLAAAKARLEQIRWEIGNTVIRAPYAGVLNERPVELGAFLQVGDPVGTIVDDLTLLLTAQAPQLAVIELKLGQKVEATLINGVVLNGVLSYVSTIAEKGTRSYRIEARVENPKHLAYTGLSATLKLPVGKSVAHKISPSALGLDALGRLIVKGVDEHGNVVVKPVELLRRERDSMWVSGLPMEFKLITLGQEYLAVGEKVEVIQDDRS